MITASVILYNTDNELISTFIGCADNSCIEHIYIIDNSPSDDLKGLVFLMSKKIEYIFGQGNIGYGAGHNIALRKAIEAGSTYHVILNPDIQFENGTIEKLAEFCDSHEGIGMVMPNVVYPNGREQYLCKMSPTPIDMFGRRLLPKKFIAKRNERFEMRSTGYKDVRNVPCLSGCFMFLNVSVIKQIGMFDDRFFMYFEDFDLIRRIHKVSKTVFYPKLTIIHNHATEHRTSKKLLKISIESAIKYFNKWGWIFDRDRWNMNKHAFGESNIIVD
jgi:GT2 family glycosyltransferase